MHGLYVDRESDDVHVLKGSTLMMHTSALCYGSAGLTIAKYLLPFLCPLELRYQINILLLGNEYRSIVIFKFKHSIKNFESPYFILKTNTFDNSTPINKIKLCE
ncbi:hypothetical protein RF11_05094 [Thelohanellus kitauei]|uniref:Uncharacterized protein n=1 Tax=Thelohanellus kitauei TaxID=669202 RepID=A0A0C2J456_THEKT|nr:hypothetical protein RF11_05094 [Thelohanellus kitauei]